MINVFYVQAEDKLEQQLFEILLQKLPPPFHKQVLKYRRWQDMQSALFGKLLLMHGMNAMGFTLFSLNDIKYNQFNRPYTQAGPDFNISHSGCITICAINTNGGKIGIDVEEIKPIPIEDFVEQFSEKELMTMKASGDIYRSFYSHWTQKEAFLKAIGTGLNVPLNTVVVENNSIMWEKRKWFLQELLIDKRYASHICLSSDDQVIALHRIDFLK